MATLCQFSEVLHCLEQLQHSPAHLTIRRWTIGTLPWFSHLQSSKLTSGLELP